MTVYCVVDTLGALLDIYATKELAEKRIAKSFRSYSLKIVTRILIDKE